MNWKGNSVLLARVLMNILIAPVTIARVCKRINKGRICGVVAGFIQLLFLVSFVTGFFLEGVWGIAGFCYFAFALFLTSIRLEVRRHLEIVEGSVFEDFFVSFLFYPSVVVQMDATLSKNTDV